MASILVDMQFRTGDTPCQIMAVFRRHHDVVIAVGDENRLGDLAEVLPSLYTNFGFYELTLFTVFYGLDWLATVPPTVKLAAQKFGSNATIVFGWVFFGHQIGAAVAAWGAGLTRSIYATYLPAFYIAGTICLIAAIAVFAIQKAHKTPEPQTA